MITRNQVNKSQKSGHYTGQQVVFHQKQTDVSFVVFLMLVFKSVFTVSLAIVFSIFFVMKVTIYCMIFGIVSPSMCEDFTTALRTGHFTFVMRNISQRVQTFRSSLHQKVKDHSSLSLYCRNL